MAFIMSCNNKGCGKTNEPMLDKQTNQVYCSECGEVMSNVTEFTKNSMRTLGQYKRENKMKAVFAMKCNGCGKTEQPKLQSNSLVCPKCGVTHQNLSPVYAHAVKEFLRSGGNQPL